MSTWTPQKLTQDDFNILGAQPIFQFLSKDPDEDQTNGNINAIANYATDTDFCITAKSGFLYILYTMHVSVRDAGAFDTGGYGNGITLSNGVKFVNGSKKVGSEFEFEITQGLPIIVNPDWETYTGTAQLSEYGSGDGQLNAEWNFPKMGRPVILDGDISEFACVRLKDDFTDLTGHYFHIQGMKIRKKY